MMSFHLYNSQNLPTQNNNYGIPKVIAPSQETFANSRINFEQSSSGEFNYQLPIYENLKTPVTLNYTSGVRVDDIGSSTGMSWQLGAGGVISRIVKDETDENHTNWKPTTINEASDLQQIKSAALTGNAIDTEYDWFNFSVSSGLSGSFYIDKDLNVFIESKDKVKIEIFDLNTPIAGYGKMLEFKLTDKYGSEYYFGGALTNIERTTYQASGPDQQAITGWYLYKIITPQKKEIIYNYAVENVTYYASLNAGFSVQQNCTDSSGTHYIYSDISKSKTILQSYKPRLLNIVEENKQISFIYGKERKDIFNSNPENNLLTSIEIKNGNLVVEKYNIEYQDVQSFGAATYYGLPSDENSTRNRHFLKSLKNINKNISTDFSYYDLDKLPARFSLSSDYYGYPNQKSNSSPFPAPAAENNFGIFQGFSNIMPLSMLSANKKVEPALASVGNLKQITHSTKGISEIVYEPNSSAGQKSVIVSEQYSLAANYNSCSTATDHPLDSFTFISTGGAITCEGYAFFDDFAGCGQPDTIHDIHSLKITDLTTGTTSFQQINNKVDLPISANTGTISGHTYKVEYSVKSTTGAVTGYLNFSYNPHTVIQNEPIYFGGSRVASIKESDVEGDNYIRKFYYNPLVAISDPKTSIADYNTIYIGANIRETSKSCQFGTTFPVVEIVNIYTAYQDNLLPAFNHRKNKVTYTDITELIENKSAIERKFSFYENTDPFIGRAPEIYNIPKTNSGELKSNLLLEENIYKFENGIYNKTINKTYKYDYNQVKTLKSYVFKENFTYYPDPNLQDQLINISHGYYENYYGFYNPTQIKTIEYLSNNQSLTTTITNSYANPNHYQLTSSQTEFPDQTTEEISYSYAHEKGNQLMIDKNMIGIPLISQTKKNNNAVSKTETIYPTSVPTATTGNLVLPTSVITYDLPNLIVGSTEITYDKYDDKGNLLQYTTKNGVPVTIIWGYNKTQPIAKIEGVELSNIQQPLIDLIVSESDTDALAGTNNDETAILNALATFRNSYPRHHVTTFTYDLLIGVRSITPPSGIREVYIYDSANRLKEIREQSQTGKILKEYQYNYKH